MLSKSGLPIRSLEDWAERAGPKLQLQWKANRSAYEAARAWLAVQPPELPAEVAFTIGSHAHFDTILEWHGEPEVKLPLDRRRGESRNTDLLIDARDASGLFLIAVEAKADEPFDRTLSEVLANALEAKLANPRSKALARVEDLATSLLGARVESLPHAATLRYQLFTAAVGALRKAESRGIERTVLLIHEFFTDETVDELHERNRADLNHWLQRISGGSITELPANTLVGPIGVPGLPLLTGTSKLYVGKAARSIRAGNRSV